MLKNQYTNQHDLGESSLISNTHYYFVFTSRAYDAESIAFIKTNSRRPTSLYRLRNFGFEEDQFYQL